MGLCLGGMRETLAVIFSSHVFVDGCGSDTERNLVAATAPGLVDNPVVELFAVAETVWFSCWKYCSSCRMPGEFPCRDSFRTPHKEETIFVAMCLTQSRPNSAVIVGGQRGFAVLPGYHHGDCQS